MFESSNRRMRGLAAIQILSILFLSYPQFINFTSFSYPVRENAFQCRSCVLLDRLSLTTSSRQTQTAWRPEGAIHLAIVFPSPWVFAMAQRCGPLGLPVRAAGGRLRVPCGRSVAGAASWPVRRPLSAGRPKQRGVPRARYTWPWLPSVATGVRPHTKRSKIGASVAKFHVELVHVGLANRGFRLDLHHFRPDLDMLRDFCTAYPCAPTFRVSGPSGAVY